MERSAIRESEPHGTSAPDFAALHPGYKTLQLRHVLRMSALRGEDAVSLTAGRRAPAPTGSKRVDAARLAELAARVTTVPGAERDDLEVENRVYHPAIVSINDATRPVFRGHRPLLSL